MTSFIVKKRLKKAKCKKDNLRLTVLMIGYLHVISGLTNVLLNMTVFFIMSQGFQCDVNIKLVKEIKWQMLEPFLLVVNMGTQNFNPFPFGMRVFVSNMEREIPSPPKCYPSMLHIYYTDVFEFITQVIWIKISLDFIAGVKKNMQNMMSVMIAIIVLKLTLQSTYLWYEPSFDMFFSGNKYWCFKILDSCFGLIFITIIWDYKNILRFEKAAMKLRLSSQNECNVSLSSNEWMTESFFDIFDVDDDDGNAERRLPPPPYTEIDQDDIQNDEYYYV